MDQRLPEHYRDSVQNYIDKGHPVGGFLYAVFCNDLVNAFNRATVSTAVASATTPNFSTTMPQKLAMALQKPTKWIKSGGLIGQTTTAEPQPERTTL